MDGDYQFDDVDTSVGPEPAADPGMPASPAPAVSDDNGMPASDHGSTPGASFGSGGQGGRSYADEVFSKKISAKFRTFFVDLKQSSNGMFLKISEKSRGRKSTIMMDAEDVPEFIEALKEVQTHL